ncbi:uncharacterized protein LOC105835039 [Monomorium pharaonis]|uniref:uncharacterized protein LOC105835039 n=1 Tax=Monomorium pharaonis TaxID=307658 RepID=UPI001745F0B6|nr:uncharacterized protein LOC105835039 [Monomorium pharaonis]
MLKKKDTILFMLVLEMDTTKSSGYKDFMWAVELHRLGMGLVGLWPKTEKFIKESLWSEIRVGIIFILLLFIYLPMLSTVIRVSDNMILLIDSLLIAVPTLIILIKYIIMQWKRTFIFVTINMMAEDWMTFKQDAERNVMIRQARTARLVMMIGYIIAILGVLTVIVPPYFGSQIQYTMNLTDRSKLLPLETFHFYDAKKSPQYELTYFIHSITAWLGAVIYMSVDIFLILTIFHVCGQLENFRCQLVNLVSCKHYNKVLNNIIATHLRLIRRCVSVSSLLYNFALKGLLKQRSNSDKNLAPS